MKKRITNSQDFASVLGKWQLCRLPFPSCQLVPRGARACSFPAAQCQTPRLGQVFQSVQQPPEHPSEVAGPGGTAVLPWDTDVWRMELLPRGEQSSLESPSLALCSVHTRGICVPVSGPAPKPSELGGKAPVDFSELWISLSRHPVCP